MASIGLEVPVEFRPDDAYEHGVCRFLIYSRGPDGQARFSISHQPGGRLSTEIRVDEQDFVDRTVRLTRRAAEELLAIELTLPGHDVLFEEALAASLR